MKQLKLNNQVVNVFNEITAPACQIAPGCTQINVGVNAASIALTISTYWWKGAAVGSVVITGGNRIEKI